MPEKLEEVPRHGARTQTVSTASNLYMYAFDGAAYIAHFFYASTTLMKVISCGRMPSPQSRVLGSIELECRQPCVHLQQQY